MQNPLIFRVGRPCEPDAAVDYPHGSNEEGRYQLDLDRRTNVGDGLRAVLANRFAV